MSELSARLSLPYLQPAQAQKHVTHNTALELLDGMVQLVLQDSTAEVPPATPVLGQAYGLGETPTQEWAGQAGQIAIFQGGDPSSNWQFIAPAPGWRAWDVAAQILVIWDGKTWGGLERLMRLGLGTSADDTNRLAIASAATLLSHAGAGHQVKINKSDPAETASLLFQSNWIGHAEIGLTGSTDLSVKLSDDGTFWRDAFVAQAATGRIGLGENTPVARLQIHGAGSGDDYLVAGDTHPLFRLASDGNGACAGAWSGGGADYAEYFEWLDGNPNNEDRRGVAVCLHGDKIRAAQTSEQPIGVVSSAPCVIGNDDLGQWQGRYLRDTFGALRRDNAGSLCENPAFDPKRHYNPRAQRPEWAVVGLLGRLRLRADQPTDPRWICLGEVDNQDTSAQAPSLKDWLVLR